MLAPGESIAVRNPGGTDAQVSFLLLAPDDEQGFIPAGRWWTRDTGEVRVVGNPTSVSRILLVEVEGVFEDAGVTLEVEPSSSPTRLFNLDTMLGAAFQGIETSFEDLVDRSFTLPRTPSASSDSATSTADIFFGDLSIPVETDLLIGLIDSTPVSTLRADETESADELRLLVEHEAAR